MKAIRDIIRWIKNRGMEFTSGRMAGFIRGTFKMTIVMDSESFTTEKSACTEVIG